MHDGAVARTCILERLREQPTMLYACAKCGVGRATAYRWMDEAPEFAEEVKSAQQVGRGLFCDVSETSMFRAAKDGDLKAARFILEHLHPAYRRTPTIVTLGKKRGLAEMLQEALGMNHEAQPSRATPHVRDDNGPDSSS